MKCEHGASSVKYNRIIFKGLCWLGILNKKVGVEYKLELYTL